MKNTESKTSYPIVKNSILLLALIIPALSVISIFSELSIVKTELDLLSQILDERKAGTLRRIKSAVDSIEFLGFSLSDQDSRALREKLIRNFMYSYHYFEEVSLIEAKNIISLVREGDMLTKNTKSLNSQFLPKLQQSSKYRDDDYYNFEIIGTLGGEPKHHPKLSISKTVPGKPLWLIVGIIDSHDLLYPINNIDRTAKPKVSYESFACLQTAEGNSFMVYRKSRGEKKEKLECHNSIMKTNDTIGAIRGKDLTAVIDLDTSEASKIDLLGHHSRPHNLETMTVKFFTKIKSHDLNSFLTEELMWSEIGLFFVGVAIFTVGHYGLNKAYETAKHATRLQSLASIDALTGIYNRREILSVLEDEIRKGNSESYLLFLDIDNFKEVNDSLGHDTGDEVIRHVCKQAFSCIRKSDKMGRIGGDEILILLNGVGSKNNALKIAKIVAEKCNAPLASGQLYTNVTVSIGLAACGASKTAREWVECADLALYKAKKAGRNCVETNDEDYARASKQADIK